jgi:hypothetical protein
MENKKPRRCRAAPDGGTDGLECGPFTPSPQRSPASSAPAPTQPLPTTGIKPGCKFGDWVIAGIDPSGRRALCVCRCETANQIAIDALPSGASQGRNLAVADGVIVLDLKPVVSVKSSEAVQQLRIAEDLEGLADSLEALAAS